MTETKEGFTSKNILATLDIFAGCGGLSEGLTKAGSFFFHSFNLSFCMNFIIK